MTESLGVLPVGQRKVFALTSFSQPAMIQIAAAVRHAIVLPPVEARRTLDLFKRMLPKDLSALG